MKPTPNSYKIPRPITDEKLAWNVIAVMWDHATFYGDEDTYQKSLAPATKGQLAIYACTWYLSEVRNGGHDQFFNNCTGMVWEDALAGFKLLNAPEHANILAEAVAAFPNSKPAKDEVERMAQCDSIDDGLFTSLDDRLYALDENFESLARVYIHNHPEEFFLENAPE